MSESTAQPQTITQRIESLESSVTNALSKFNQFAPLLTNILGVIPGASTAVADIGIAEKVAGITGQVLNIAEGNTDAATQAAASISASTGNPDLDGRLAAIETFIENAAPCLAAIAKEFGLTAPVSTVVSVATQAANAAMPGTAN